MRGPSLTLAFLAATLVLSACSPTPRDSVSPACDFSNGSVLLLAAQSVPTAELIPCIEQLPIGWSFRDIVVTDGLTQFRLDSDRVGQKFLEISLTAACSREFEGEPHIVEGGITWRLIDTELRGAHYEGDWFFAFEGGCVTYSFAAMGGEAAGVGAEAEEALAFVSRAAVDRFVRDAVGIRLDPTSATILP